MLKETMMITIDTLWDLIDYHASMKQWRRVHLLAKMIGRLTLEVKNV
jgi:hypothetical protein